MESIQRLFEKTVQEHPKSCATIYKNSSVNYHQFNKLVNKLAYFLMEQGVKRESMVALALERTPQVLLSIFAIIKSGGCYVPLDIANPKARLIQILNASNTPFLITQKSLKEKFKGFNGQLLIIDEIDTAGYSAVNPPIASNVNDLAYIIYTSGSTGEPKGVLINQQNVINYCQNFAINCNITARPRIDFSANYAFDMAVTNTLVALVLGLTVVIVEDDVKKDCYRYLDYLVTNHINIIKVTPSYFKVLLFEIEKNKIKMPNLQSIILGGEKLNTLDCALWQKEFPHHSLINEYGPTETTVGVTWYHFTNQGINAIHPEVPMGKPGKDIEFYLVNEQKLVKEGEVGELYIGGKCVGRGYLNKPELTEERFMFLPFHKGRLYKTGDLCRKLSDGNYEYLGRLDHQVKIRGFRIELGEIEACINKFANIKKAVVVADVIDKESDEKQLIVYYLQQNTKQNLDVLALKNYLNDHLTEAMIPSFFVKVDSFPLTANGKLDLKNLPAIVITKKNKTIKISDKLTSKIATIWQEELNNFSLGVHDNFFELGGHSLLAARIVTSLKYQLKKEITVADFYQNPTISELAVFLKNSKKLTKNKKVKINNKILPLNDFQFLLWLAHSFEPKTKKINIVGQRRLSGIIDAKKLNFALNELVKKQPILAYKILNLKPALKFQTQLINKVEIFDLRDKKKFEENLEFSFYELHNLSFWPPNSALIKIRLFLLPDNQSEIQIALPHLIADGSSIEMVFKDLSHYYLAYPRKAKPSVLTKKNYYDFVVKEKEIISENSERDLSFWHSYFKSTGFLAFDDCYISKSKQKRYTYSNYFRIEKDRLNNLHDLATTQHKNFNTLLIATVCASLAKHAKKEQKNSCIVNLVKSSREDKHFDNILGCFLRVEPINLNFADNPEISYYFDKIKEQIAFTEKFQKTSAIIKYANLEKAQQKNSGLKFNFLKILSKFFVKICPALLLNSTVLTMMGRLSAFKVRNNFMININIWDNFNEISKNKEQKKLFTLQQQPASFYPCDLLSIDNILDICFTKNNDDFYLVISGNLKPSFRQELAFTILENLYSLNKLLVG